MANFTGTAANDTIVGSTLPDRIDGGTGNDLVFGYGDGSGVGAAPPALDPAGGGAQDDDELIGSDGNDTIHAGGGADILRGGPGADLLFGDDGDDELLGGGGNDVLHGGPGENQLTGDEGDDRLVGGPAMDIMNGGSGHDLLRGGGGGDWLAGGDGEDEILGGAGDDRLTGGSQADRLSGGGGHDRLFGGSGDDALDGGLQHDQLSGEAGDDELDGGTGDDVIDGGNGIDTVMYMAASGPVVVNLADGMAHSDGDRGKDQVSGVENVIGSGFDDSLTGDSLSNSLEGGAGDDLLNGGSGDDALLGGTGRDTVTYASAERAVMADLARGTARDGESGTDTLAEIENVVGSEHDDVLQGDAAGNHLSGLAGTDLLRGGPGDDRLDGGGGIDTVSYSDSSTAVSASLSSGAASADGSSDRLMAIENLTGSAFDDRLIGNAADNVLAGGSGSDVLHGGGGRDTVSYASSPTAIAVDLSAGTAIDGLGAVDSLAAIEDVSGSAHDDRIAGDSNANVLHGRGGNDLLIGGAGRDTVSYISARSAVTVDLAAGAASDDGEGGSDVLAGIENIAGSRFSDSLAGDAGANRIDGGLGADVIFAGGGHDVLVASDGPSGTGSRDDRLDGGTGLDTAVFSGSFLEYEITSVGETTKVRDLTLLNGGDGTDILTNVERLQFTDRTVDVPGPLSVIDLGRLDPARGFTILGADGEDKSATSVASAGDVNGDGFDDVLIGAPWADGPDNARDYSGESYLIFGRAGGIGSTLDLARLQASQGAIISGAARLDQTGEMVSSAGDLNGDGFDDLVVGSYEGFIVLYGREAGLGGSIDLATLDPGQGFAISGLPYGADSLSNAGDVNGDGFDDLIIGAVRDWGLHFRSGQVYVVFGADTGLESGVDLEALTASQGFILSGASQYDAAGASVSDAGDVNGDGLGDIIVGAPREGEAYVVFGSTGAFDFEIDLGELRASQGLVIKGALGLGSSVSGAGDVNGDQVDDMIVGSYGEDAAYVIFGSETGFGARLDIASLTPEQGFVISAADENDANRGVSVSDAGDVNGDGLGDLLIGFADGDVAGNEKRDAGESYVVFGREDGFGSGIDLSALTPTQGFVLYGADPDDNAGAAVSAAGDLDGDGLADLIIGAEQADSIGDTRNWAGESYVIFGDSSLGEVDLPAPGADVRPTLSGDTVLGGKDRDEIVLGAEDTVLPIRACEGDGPLTGGLLTFPSAYPAPLLADAELTAAA